jgi:hypothetical protein
MPPVGFEPAILASKWSKTHAFYSAATETDEKQFPESSIFEELLVVAVK